MNSKNILIGAIAAGILIASAVSAYYLDRTGRQARVYAGPAHRFADPGLRFSVIATADELYALYKNKNVHGRVLVHVGKYLQSVDLDIAGLVPGEDGYPSVIPGMLPLFEMRLSYQNIFWVCGQANMARELIYVQPPGMFRKRWEAVDDRDAELISKNRDAVVLHDWGSRRTITDRMPLTTEPVLLNIDASAFEELRPEQLFGILRSSSLRADLITLNLSRDNPDITDAARKSLLLFGAMLDKEGPR